ncbi:MAG: hypothetical protein HQ596_00445 [Candidatus Saganbacteria bacterium]|nr:hypothetical protein [Candidatus Saganbacteria bacterium]
MTLRVAVNGVRGPGKGFIRAWAQKLAMAGRETPVKLVAINDAGHSMYLRPVLSHSSAYGPFPVDVEVWTEERGGLEIGGQKVVCFAERDVSAVSWQDLNIDVLVDASSTLKNESRIRPLLEDGIGAVLTHSLVNPDVDRALQARVRGTQDNIPIRRVVYGVNEGRVQTGDQILDQMSFMTQVLAVLAKALQDRFPIAKMDATIIQAMRDDQRVVDDLHRDPRRGFAASQNIVPNNPIAYLTALSEPAFANFAGRVYVSGARVPVIAGAQIKVAIDFEEKVGGVEAQQLQHHLRVAARGPLRGVLEYSDDLTLVSSHVIAADLHHYLAVVDGGSISTQGENSVRINLWADPDMSFAHQTLRVLEHMAKMSSS